MVYRTYKSIGKKVSLLGFGAMRLPMLPDGKVNRLKSTRLLRAAYRAGVNYFDSAYVYHRGESEVVLAHAVKPFRDKVIVSSKNYVLEDETQQDWMKRFDVMIERLQGHMDILNMHTISWKVFQKKIRPKRKGVLGPARKAQAQGLFDHLAFSSHDTPENIIKLIDTGEFVGVTLQYNMLDRVNEPVIEHAHKKGVAVILMGPVGGGRLAAPSKKLQQAVPGGVKSTPELALRFVFSNPHVTCALSGMNEMRQLRENVAVASMKKPFSAAEKRKVRAALRQLEKLSQLYCTGCGYCMPCPHGVNIPRCFELMNMYRVWGLEEVARTQYALLTDAKRRGLHAGYCKKCGKCMPKCPQKIDIIHQLEETHAALGG